MLLSPSVMTVSYYIKYPSPSYYLKCSRGTEVLRAVLPTRNLLLVHSPIVDCGERRYDGVELSQDEGYNYLDS